MENKALDCYHKLLKEGYPEKSAQRLRLAEGEYDAREYVRNHLFNFQVNPPVVNGLLPKHIERLLGEEEAGPFLPRAHVAELGGAHPPRAKEVFTKGYAYVFLMDEVIAHIGNYLNDEPLEYINRVVQRVIDFKLILGSMPEKFTPSNDLVIRGATTYDKVRISYEPMKGLITATLGDIPLVDFGYDDDIDGINVELLRVPDYLTFFFLLELAQNYYHYSKESNQGDITHYFLNEFFYVVDLAKDVYDEEYEAKDECRAQIKTEPSYFYGTIVPYISLRRKDYEV